MTQSDFFDQYVPARFQKALTKLILESCKQSSKHCYRNFSAEQAKDVSGPYRRAKIENELAGVTALFRNDVGCQVKQFKNNTGSYNELTIGPVRLTQSCITTVDEVPRGAEFRSSLAKNGQRSFSWESPEPAEDYDLGFRYAILTYGIDLKSPRRSWPAFIKFQFPNETFTRYLDEGIDLFKRFPDLVAEYVPRPTFERQITRRRRRRAVGE